MDCCLSLGRRVMPKQYRYTKKTGRPTKYDPAYSDRLLTFFSRKPYSTLKFIRQASDPPLLIDFAASIHVHLATLYDWEKAHTEFHEALQQARELQHKYYLICGVLGLTNPAITALILKNNHGYKDRNGNGNGHGDGNGGNTHIQVTVKLEAPKEQLAGSILSHISRRTALAPDHA